MKKICVLFISVLIIQNLVSGQCGTGRYSDSLFTTSTVTTVKYGAAPNYAGTNTNLYVDIYTPDGDTATKRPLLIFCFGGAFVAGSRTAVDMVYFSKQFAKRGYVCASIDYRLDTYVNLLSEEGCVKALGRAMQDAKAAVRFFRANASTYGIDSSIIFIGGTSAGALAAIHTAYLDSTELTPTWLSWMNQIGGVEGNSGTPNISSKVKAVYSFAGAIGDTSWINPSDAPIYACHSTGDATVKNGYGKPLSGIAPINLYGDSLINRRTKNINVYSVFDEYTGNYHPPFYSPDLTVYSTTDNHLKTFLYDVQCNSKLATNNTERLNAIIRVLESKKIQITANGSNPKSISIYSLNGEKQLSKTFQPEIDVHNLQSGMYFVELTSETSSIIQKIIVE